MKKRAISLALVLCLGLLPATVSAAEANFPEWYFLFAIFKNVDADVKDGNGNFAHQKYTIPQEEIDGILDNAKELEEYLNQVGVMRAHVEVVEIDEPVTELCNDYEDGGSYLDAGRAASLLEGKVDLDRYDHVTCILNLNTWTRWAGISPGIIFENGTGISNVNFQTGERYREDVLELASQNVWGIQLYVHEFLHFMERMSDKWGSTFALHRDGKTHYIRNDDWKTYYTDTILNRLSDLDIFPDGGTGVHPAAWQYPPHVLRTMTELTVPSGVTGIGHDAFLNYTNLTRVTTPSSVTCIDVSAFHGCTGLTSVTIPASVTSIENWAFGHCTALTEITMPATVTSIGYAAFWETGIKDVYYGGTEAQWKAIRFDEFNSALTNAAIHYNSLMADVKTSDWFAQPVVWALEKGITTGTGGGNFSPGSTCTQGQILTFLWRAKGSPTPARQVNGTEYYAAAVQWAKEQGLVGVVLDPGSPCTRADVVVYLWQLAGKPEAKTASFSDIPANASYAKAVSWAAETGITSGISNDQFAPGQTCTRGQIVTFLYRALAE